MHPVSPRERLGAVYHCLILSAHCHSCRLASAGCCCCRASPLEVARRMHAKANETNRLMHKNITPPLRFLPPALHVMKNGQPLRICGETCCSLHGRTACINRLSSKPGIRGQPIARTRLVATYLLPPFSDYGTPSPIVDLELHHTARHLRFVTSAMGFDHTGAAVF